MGPETKTVEDIADRLGWPVRRVQRMAKKQRWRCKKEKCPGGKRHHYIFDSLPVEIQKSFDPPVDPPAGQDPPPQGPDPGAALALIDQDLQIPLLSAVADGDNGDGGSQTLAAWSPERALGLYDLNNPYLAQKLAILREVEDVPRCWDKGRRAYVEAIALKHGISAATVYRWVEKRERRDIAGLKHTKSSAGKPRAWDPEALEFWIGLCLKQEHRKIDKKALYGCLLIEAQRRGWRVGRYESAFGWYKKRATPQLLAIQRAAVRGLDNVLPPIRRDYSDLTPFEILCGDQHRFDFWVVDDESGEVFRPEGYLWQDLRTRLIYGAAIDKRYDAWLIGMALRIGIRCYGAFGSVYTDNGKPELSRYLMGVLAGMRALNLGWEREEDLAVGGLDADPEQINPSVILPGSHRKAIVKNAKAKMIESTIGNIKKIMRGHFRLPGYVKELAGDNHEQDVDEKEVRRLAEQGKLPLYSEFILTLYRSLDYYNRERAHRGVLSEWIWPSKPKSATPYDCLRACCAEGWRPRQISEEAADLIFLARESRIVNLGRVQFQNDFFEHEALIELHKEQVDIRYDPLDPEWVMVFREGRYICRAESMEWSSMKDQELAKRKISEKRARQRKFLEQYRALTAKIPDMREYSKVPQIEKVAAIVGMEKKKRAAEQQELYRVHTAEEIEAHIARMERAELAQKRLTLESHLPKAPGERPSFFLYEFDRYKWCAETDLAGGTLTPDDRLWMEQYERTMEEGDKEYWENERECARAVRARLEKTEEG